MASARQDAILHAFVTTGMTASVAAPRDATLLSNGRYTVMLTGAGSGFSRWGELAVTRWREDPTCDGWGSYILVSDPARGSVWSASLQPFGDGPDAHPAAFCDGRVEYARSDADISTRLEVAVAADVDGELRRVTLTNHGDAARALVLTSYAELVLGSAAADATHPAFSKLFVQTEAVDDGRLLLATRRRRAPAEPEIWAAHFAVVEGPAGTGLEFETDRARFLGRGRTLRDAQASQAGSALSNTVGAVLDPIFSLRQRVSVPPRSSVRVTFWTMAAGTRAAVLAFAGAARAPDHGERALEGAAARAVSMRAALGVEADAARRWERLVAPLLTADARWRSPAPALGRGRGGAPTLWGSGISGDRPIVLMRIAGDTGLEQVRALLRAQLHWRAQRLGVDVVLLDCATGRDSASLGGTLDMLADQHRTLLAAGADVSPAAVFALRDGEIPEALRDGLATAARVVLDASGEFRHAPMPPAADDGARPHEAAPGRGRVSGRAGAPGVAPIAAAAAPLAFANGTGGFDAAAREYVVTLADGRCTPAPWVNIVANPAFGFMASAEGGGYTWSVNSQQNALTPWPNDPVSDTPHEALYLRDEDGGDVWSATALPIRVPSARYVARHGKGTCRFTVDAHEIDVELLQCVPVDDSVKVSRLRLRNRSARVRRLSVTAYVEWALGANGTVPAPFVVTAIDPATGALFARNAWRAEFGERVAFADLGGAHTSLTADRTEFLGRHGALARPAALADAAPLSGRVGAGLDPCAALQTRVELAPGAVADVVFALGDAASAAAAQALIEKYRGADVDEVAREAQAPWDAMLDTVQVRTPARAMDVMLNDWLLYQALACRMWARTAYYQASGAYGFRDQLQDAMSLCVARPDVARAHLLRAAARQFPEGDVQHWWLPPAGQGIRTRMTDDRVWLAYVASHYVGVTGDTAVLDEAVPFLAGRALAPGEGEAFFEPAVNPDGAATLYEHCARGLDISLALGEHGLPLIGTGDWNDGMNRVGAEGRGESTWLAWFLLATIDAFAPAAAARGDDARVARWRQWSAAVRAALEGAGWDGEWYRRGYYDDGAPLGSRTSSECRIDAIPQSWSVIAGGNDPGRGAQAMEAVERHLIDHHDRIALLFTPPFDHTSHDPGYIKGYPPGIRENGGQYTHGTIWSIFAFAALGQGERAADLFAILNPVTHSDTPEAAARYKVEPYVACADVYSVAPHAGRGGWTWYTGSAGWLYRAGLEAILGFRLRGNALVVDPCVPKAWPGFEIHYRRRGDGGRVTRYEIAVENPRGVSRGVVAVELDGARIAQGMAPIPLRDDGRVHRVRIELG